MSENTIDVRGDEKGEFFLLIHRVSGEIVGAAYRRADGWWIGKDVTGTPRKMYPPSDVPDIRLHLANQLIHPY